MQPLAAPSRFTPLIPARALDTRGGGRHLHLHQRILLLAAVELIQRQLRPLPADDSLAADEAERPHAVRELDFDDDAACDDVEHVTQLGGEDPRQLAAVLDEVGVAVAALRQAGHEIFIEPQAQADGRDGDALLDERGAEPAEILRRARPDVGQPVR